MKQQKFVVGDEYGTLSSFQIKKGEPQVNLLLPHCLQFVSFIKC